jgi:uncharacterized lipoprotein YajG
MAFINRLDVNLRKNNIILLNSKKNIIMRKILFIAFLGIVFLAGCKNKSKEATEVVATDQIQDTVSTDSIEIEGAIDDSGEIGQDSTENVESE